MCSNLWLSNTSHRHHGAKDLPRPQAGTDLGRNRTEMVHEFSAGCVLRVRSSGQHTWIAWIRNEDEWQLCFILIAVRLHETAYKSPKVFLDEY